MIRSALSPSRLPRIGISRRWGTVLLVSGSGLLAFASVCLFKTSESYLEIQGTTLFLFAVAVGLMLTGEMLRAAGRVRSGRPKWDWLESTGAHRLAGGRLTRLLLESKCAFCGKSATSAGNGRKTERRPEGTEEAADSHSFGRCLNCGRTVCPRCGFLKGLEMGRDSLRCPGCGGQVY